METPLKSLADLDAAVVAFLAACPRGAVVGLIGELGAGKTTFVRSAIALLAARSQRKPPRVTSPTFVLHQSYPALPVPVEHFDLYRMENADAAALLEIGYFEAIDTCRSKHGFVFVEWPERAAATSVLRLERLIHIAFAGEYRVLQIRSVPDEKK